MFFHACQSFRYFSRILLLSGCVLPFVFIFYFFPIEFIQYLKK
jgi:hypothetical protein